MNTLTPITGKIPFIFCEGGNDLITIRLELIPAEAKDLIEDIASENGPMDVYCWYEGPQGLPASGARFMKEEILEPLYEKKKDATVFLYSLKGWDFTKKVSQMSASSTLGEAIMRIESTAIRCIYASDFFKYCSSVVRKEEGEDLYTYLQKELPKKQWLISLSEGRTKGEFTVGELFDSKSSLLDCLRDRNAGAAYSQMQYVEGYYLIRSSVERALAEDRREITIVFLLANDEAKYYADYPEEIEKYLKIDFGKQLDGRRVNISFRFFLYGETLEYRTYIDKRAGAAKVKPKEVVSYFDYLATPRTSSNSKRSQFSTDELNGAQ